MNYLWGCIKLIQIEQIETYLPDRRFIPNDKEEVTAIGQMGKLNTKMREVVTAINTMLTEGIKEPITIEINRMAQSGELWTLIQELIVLEGGTF